MKRKEKEKAIILRRKGLSYGEISQRLPVAKSTLSSWLRDIELTEEQLRRIHKKNMEIRRKFIEYNNLKRQEALRRKETISLAAQEEIDRISRRELKLIGIALYWAEGSKASGWSTVAFSNSDPNMILLVMRWFREICEVPEEKFRLKVQAYNESKIKNYERFWSELAKVPLGQFIKPYVKISKYSKLRRGNTLPYGTLHIRISDVKLLSRISGWINAFRGPIV